MMSATKPAPGGASLGLGSPWLARTEVQAAEWTLDTSPAFPWQETAGIDFETEIESVSRLFPLQEPALGPRHQQLTPAEALLAAALSPETSSRDDDALVEQQAVVCGQTLLSPEEETMSPEQCLMSPSDLCLTSSPGVVSPVQVQTATDDYVKQVGNSGWGFAAANVAFTELEKSGGVSVEDVAPSPSLMQVQTIIEHVSPQDAFAQAVSEVFGANEDGSFAKEEDVKEVDESDMLIDQGLEDLKVLESMCGITSPDLVKSAPSVPTLEISQPTTSSPSSGLTSPPLKRSLPADHQASTKFHKSNEPTGAVNVVTPIKQEPVEEDDIQIVEEVSPLPTIATKPSRRRAPKVAIVPHRVAPSPCIAAKPTQLVIVLTGEQLASIQKSGQLVLSASSLQTASASATPTEVKTGVSLPKKTAAVKGCVRQPAAVGMKKARSRRVPAATVTSSKQTPRKTSGKEPLSEWAPQKQAPATDLSEWAFPMVPPSALDPLPPEAPDVADDRIPDDLQDLFMDSPAVASLPSDDASTILDDLISGSVCENPQLFGYPSSEEEGEGEQLLRQQLQQPQLWTPSPASEEQFSPCPRQVSVESWSPTLSPSPADPWSPSKYQADAELTSGPDWSPRQEATPSRHRGNRPRPYDKQPERATMRKPPLSEEEKRLRKKEQNKNAATRYRQKKKEEHDLVSCDQDRLESRNKQLRSRVAGLTKELVYLRQLMREVLRHRSAT